MYNMYMSNVYIYTYVYIYNIDVIFPLVGWLIEGLKVYPFNQVNDDRWYTKTGPSIFTKRTLLKIF